MRLVFCCLANLPSRGKSPNNNKFGTPERRSQERLRTALEAFGASDRLEPNPELLDGFMESSDCTLEGSHVFASCRLINLPDHTMRLKPCTVVSKLVQESEKSPLGCSGRLFHVRISAALSTTRLRKSRQPKADVTWSLSSDGRLSTSLLIAGNAC
jgi:hypothetical protein